MCEKEQQGEHSILTWTLKWFNTPRKNRKEIDWEPLYRHIIAILLPELRVDQLLVSKEHQHEHFHLFFNSLTLIQKAAQTYFTEHLNIDILILIKGSLTVQKNTRKIESPALIILPMNKNGATNIRTFLNCLFLKTERKHLEKLKFDIMKQDREIKLSFLSNHLFCGLTPVFPPSALQLINIKENTSIDLQGDDIVLLREGVIRRRPRKKGQGSQLTSGAILNISKLSSLLQLPVHNDDDILTSMMSCVLIRFECQEFLRILKLNQSLRVLLEHKIQTISSQRLYQQSKAVKLNQNFTERMKEQTGTVRINYSIEFKSKNRPKTAMARSFRVKNNSVTNDMVNEFITFDKYNKMIASKEKVIAAKNFYEGSRNVLKKQVNHRITTGQYEKRIKQQNKLFKLQSGKIQKLSQRQSKVDNICMREIKKNLSRVTHLFDEPLDPSLTDTPNPKSSQQKNPISRMSNLKPEEYLKEDYLSAFLKNNGESRRVSRNKESSHQSEKQNLMPRGWFSKTDGFSCEIRVNQIR